MTELKLRCASSEEWVRSVLENFDLFLGDHALCERKASATAMMLVSHYPDRPELVHNMIALAREELEHFHQVWLLMNKRGLVLPADSKDPYIQKLLKHVRSGRDGFFLDRLLVSGIIEARGNERFELLAPRLHDEELRDYYAHLAEREKHHGRMFINLALKYFDDEVINERLNALLDREAEILPTLEHNGRLH